MTTTTHKPPPLELFSEDRLPPSEETELSRRIQQGDEDALNRLVLSNMREALMYSWTCCNQNIGGDELVSLCYEALRRNALRFSPAFGKRFFAFAKAGIRGRLKLFFEESKTVRHATEIVNLPENFAPETHHTDEEPEQTPRQLPAQSEEFDFDGLHIDELYAKMTAFGKDGLHPNDQMVLDLHYSQELTFNKIGGLLGQSRAAAHLTHQKAVKRLRRLFVDSRNKFI